MLSAETNLQVTVLFNRTNISENFCKGGKSIQLRPFLYTKSTMALENKTKKYGLLSATPQHVL